MNQQTYIQKVWTRFGMNQAKPSKYLMESGHIQQKEEAEKLAEDHEYTSLIAVRGCNHSSACCSECFQSGQINEHTDTGRWVRSKKNTPLPQAYHGP